MHERVNVCQSPARRLASSVGQCYLADVSLPQTEVDLTLIATPGVAKAAAGAMSAAAIIGALTVLQLFLNVSYMSRAVLGLLVFLALASAISLAFALGIGRSRSWAAAGAPYASAVLAFVAGVWLFFSFSVHAYSFFAMRTPPLSVAGAVVSAIARTPIARANAVRVQLRRDGLDVGL